MCLSTYLKSNFCYHFVQLKQLPVVLLFHIINLIEWEREKRREEKKMGKNQPICEHVSVVPTRYSKINSIRNVIHFRIARKTTVQRHILVGVVVFVLCTNLWIGKNEKNLCATMCARTLARLHAGSFAPYLKWRKEKYGDHDSHSAAQCKNRKSNCEQNSQFAQRWWMWLWQR